MSKKKKITRTTPVKAKPQGYWVNEENLRKSERVITSKIDKKTNKTKKLVKRNRSRYDRTFTGYELTKAELRKQVASGTKVNPQAAARDLKIRSQDTRTASILTAKQFFNQHKIKKEESESETENIWIKNRNWITKPELEAEYLYIDASQIIGDRDGKWEHHGTHTFEDPEEYWKNIPPVPVTKEGNKYVFSDGFNRVNFCIKNKKKIPVVIIYRKPKTHTHEYSITGSVFVDTVFNKDCQKHKDENNARCTGHDKHLYPLKK